MSSTYYDGENKIWKGPKHETVYNSNVSLGYLVLNILKNTPERITQVSADTDNEITCDEMRLRTMKIATHLMNSGFKQGDVAGVIASNTENLAPTVFACFTLGMPINFLAPTNSVPEAANMYIKTKPKIIFCDANIMETVTTAIEKMTAKPVVYTLIHKVEGYEFVDDLLARDFSENKFR